MLQKKRILVGPLDLPGEFMFPTSPRLNPGMGGSEFHSILLADHLSKTFDVTLWVQKGSLESPTLPTIETLHTESQFDLQISFTSNAENKKLNELPLIALSHHPFDGHIASLPQRTVAIANVGRFQLLSNARGAKKNQIPQFWFPVFLVESDTNSKVTRNNNAMLAGHISSLHPSKGFHDVLAGWVKFRKNGVGILTVVGGVSLYGNQESHDFLPVSKSYGNKLLKILGDNPREDVSFLGRIPGDIANIISSWDVAILNPKALGESESVSMKDCWREGVPVIAGNRFGQRDYMKFFPELSASSPAGVARILARLQQTDKAELIGLSTRAKRVYTELVLRGNKSRIAWDKIVHVASNGGKLDHEFGLEIGPISLNDKLGLQVDQISQYVHINLSKVAQHLRKLTNNV